MPTQPTRSVAAAPLAEINMVPLIDVLLVLLVLFIVTTPLLTHSVHIELPKASSRPTDARNSPVKIDIHADGTVYWNDHAVADDEFRSRLAAAAAIDPQPELHVHADRTAQYQLLAAVLSAAASAGIARFGLVTDPQHTH